MRRLHGVSAFAELPAGCGLTVGNFDGLHLGHRALIAELERRVGRERAVVVTFEPHPLAVLRPGVAPPRLSTADQKADLLAAAGVGVLVTLDPADGLLELSAAQFVALLMKAQPGVIVEGPDFHFGKNRAGDVATLRALAGGAEVVVVEPTEVALTDASRVIAGSSLVRWLLGHGRVRDAALALGRPYTLVGEVVHGAKRGRQLGFPTANVAVDGQMVPADGVYAARCMGHAAAVSIGITPTFENRGRLVEAHLLDFAGDLYGQTLAVELIDWLRPQQKYPGVKALKLQLEKDVARTRAVAGQDPTEPIYRVA